METDTLGLLLSFLAFVLVAMGWFKLYLHVQMPRTRKCATVIAIDAVLPTRSRFKAGPSHLRVKN